MVQKFQDVAVCSFVFPKRPLRIPKQASQIPKQTCHIPMVSPSTYLTHLATAGCVGSYFDYHFDVHESLRERTATRTRILWKIGLSWILE